MPTVIVAYDSPDNRRRRQLHKLLRGFGLAHQKSVFICELTNEQANRLWQQICDIGDDELDRVSAFPINRQDYKKARFVHQSGDGEPDPEWIL